MRLILQVLWIHSYILGRNAQPPNQEPHQLTPRSAPAVSSLPGVLISRRNACPGRSKWALLAREGGTFRYMILATIEREGLSIEGYPFPFDVLSMLFLITE